MAILGKLVKDIPEVLFDTVGRLLNEWLRNQDDLEIYQLSDELYLVNVKYHNRRKTDEK